MPTTKTNGHPEVNVLYVIKDATNNKDRKSYKQQNSDIFHQSSNKPREDSNVSPNRFGLPNLFGYNPMPSIDARPSSQPNSPRLLEKSYNRNKSSEPTHSEVLASDSKPIPPKQVHLLH